MDQIKKYFSNPDSLISLFLGVAVVVVIGILISNYVQDRQGAQITNEAAQEEATASAGTPGTYTVKEGESLWDVAEETIGSGYNWVDIAEANNLTNPDRLEAGTTLTIPDVAKREPTGAVSSAQSEVNRPADGTYTVKAGDSLWNISLDVYGSGYRWPEIARLNSLGNPDIIHPGNVLQLP